MNSVDARSNKPKHENGVGAGIDAPLSTDQGARIQRVETFLAQIKQSVQASHEEQHGDSASHEEQHGDSAQVGLMSFLQKVQTHKERLSEKPEVPIVLDHPEQGETPASCGHRDIPSAQDEATEDRFHPLCSGKTVMPDRVSTKKSLRLLILNGPNLNLLGTREADIYGQTTLADIETLCRTQVQELNVMLDFFQSNHEGILVERIQQARGAVDLIIINPAAYTHTSVAIRDALLAVEIPVIEVHLSNIHKREPFRHHSYISDIALGQIVGLGPDGYRFAVEAGIRYLSTLTHHSDEIK